LAGLNNFPYSKLSEVDHQHYTLRDKIKRLRGTPVGEASGLGTENRGHRVKLDSELDDIGLFIAAISYLLYASMFVLLTTTHECNSSMISKNSTSFNSYQWVDRLELIMKRKALGMLLYKKITEVLKLRVGDLCPQSEILTNWLEDSHILLKLK
jgi:hypothetical protein